MERLDEFKTTPTVTLINMLCESEKNGEQKLVNICAYELACRIWVPNKEKDFKTMLYEFGYVDLELNKENNNKKVK
ncbi:MAG: hypothetical protein VZQ62_03360 [Methanosphaera sp.]|nr:hypothetical protein [Methanosphaera sp.]